MQQCYKVVPTDDPRVEAKAVSLEIFDQSEGTWAGHIMVNLNLDDDSIVCLQRLWLRKDDSPQIQEIKNFGDRVKFRFEYRPETETMVAHEMHKVDSPDLPLEGASRIDLRIARLPQPRPKPILVPQAMQPWTPSVVPAESGAQEKPSDTQIPQEDPTPSRQPRTLLRLRPPKRPEGGPEFGTERKS